MVLEQKERGENKANVLENLADNILNEERGENYFVKPYGEYNNPHGGEEYLIPGIDLEDADEWLGKALQDNFEKDDDNLKKNKGKEENKENLSKEQQADRLITKYTKIIKEAGKMFGVDECIIAGVIYREQVFCNVLDSVCDSLGYFGANTSMGIGQVKVDTAKLLEEKGYIKRISEEEIKNFGGERIARAKRLEDDKYNIYYVAAYLKYMQDLRKVQYPPISEKPDILATLYNIGKEEAHPNPKPNDFGRYVQSKYEHIKKLMKK